MNNNPSKEEIINKAIKFHLQGNIQEATKFYQYCINQSFNDPRVFSNYGAILLGIGKLEEAAHSFSKAIELNPNSANAYSNLGNVLRDLGKLQEAEVHTRKAIELNPNFANAYSNLGNVLRDLGKLQEAELSYIKAIKLNPNFANAYSNLGIVLKDLEKFQEAELYTRKAIELNPNFANAYSNLGNLLREQRKLQEAEVHTRKAIKLNPNNEIAHYNLGIILKDLGKLKEAELSYLEAIELNPNFANAYSNLGNVLGDLGKLQEAELYTRKAIELNPNNETAHYNLGNLMRNFGKFKEAETSYLKAIELNPNLAMAYFCLSTLNLSNKNTIWRDQLFSQNLLDKKSKKDQIPIYFARANIFHRKSNFIESSKYLQLANNLKYQLYASNLKYLINKSKELLLKSDKEHFVENESTSFPQSIFIVGMPRSGSTLLESILSMNNNVNDLGEKNILEESFLNWKTSVQKFTLADLYFNKTNTCDDKLRSTTNKWLYNYLYTGIISTQIPNSKIIHCFRNPLDNILSIFRANFAEGNEYSSSLVDCAKVYLDQEELMTKYKHRFRSKIYDLNYDLLVKNPNQEIKSLVSWLGWKWEDKFLFPHLNPRSVSTASAIQVRSPINTKSLGEWKKYKEMLRPAMEIITQKDKYKELKY